MCNKMKKIKRWLVALFIVLGLFSAADEKASAGLWANDWNYVQPFSLNPVNDGIQLGLGLTLSGSALVCDKFIHIKDNTFNADDLNKSDIAGLEQIFMRPYSKPLHIVGTGTMVLAMATPAVFGTMPSGEWMTIGTMYLETLLIANGIKEWTKLLVYRPRPYMYFDGYPQEKVDDGDWNSSFPSGHTTLAFAGAAFTTMVFCQCFPESKWKYAVAGGAFGIAAVTGALRMASGNHFLTDVLVGAVIGTTCGFAVPYMHTKSFYGNFQKKSGGARAAVSPAGFAVSFDF